MKNPKVSIVMPVYNVEMYLRECLDSVIAQTLKDIEIICVNDGSTDSSPQILEEYAQKDNRIKIISKPNSGYGHTMNCGFDAATGDYIGIVETDDYIREDMYEILYKIAVEKNLDMIKADYNIFVGDEAEREFTYRSIAKRADYYGNILDPSKDFGVFDIYLVTWSGIYKREMIETYHIRHNETPGASYQDNGFWFQTITRAKRFYVLEDALYQLRRDNPNSSVNSKAKVYCVCVEYDFIRDWLSKDKALEEKFKTLCAKYRFNNYDFTLLRVADEFKREFLHRFSEDFNKLKENGELDMSLLSKLQQQRLNQIMTDPDEYYYTKFRIVEGGTVEELQKKLRDAKTELRDIQHSKSFQIGRCITWLPRKVRAVIRYTRQHGLKSSYYRAIQTLRGKAK